MFYLRRSVYLLPLLSLALTAAAQHPSSWSFTVSGTNSSGQSISGTMNYTMVYNDSTQVMTLSGTRTFSSGWGSESGQIQIFNGSQWVVHSVSPSPANIVVSGAADEQRGIRFWWGRLDTVHGETTWYCNASNEAPALPPNPEKHSIERTEVITNTSYSPGELLIIDSDGNVVGSRAVPARFSGQIDVGVPDGGALKYREAGEEFTLVRVQDADGERWVVDLEELTDVTTSRVGEIKDGRISYEDYEIFVDPSTGQVTIAGRSVDSAVQLDEDTIEAQPREQLDAPAQDSNDVDQLALGELQDIAETSKETAQNTASIDEALRDSDGKSFLGKLWEFWGGGASEAADRDWDQYAEGLVTEGEAMIGDSFAYLDGIESGGSVTVGDSSALDLEVTIPGFGAINFDPLSALPSWFWVVLPWVREVILWAILMWFIKDMMNYFQFVATGVASSRAETTAAAIENALPFVAQIKGAAFMSVLVSVLLGLYVSMLVVLDSNLINLISGTSFSGGGNAMASIVTFDINVPGPLVYAWNFIDQLLPIRTFIGVLVAEVLTRIVVFVTSVTLLLVVRFVGGIK